MNDPNISQDGGVKMSSFPVSPLEDDLVVVSLKKVTEEEYENSLIEVQGLGMVLELEDDTTVPLNIFVAK